MFRDNGGFKYCMIRCYMEWFCFMSFDIRLYILVISHSFALLALISYRLISLHNQFVTVSVRIVFN